MADRKLLKSRCHLVKFITVCEFLFRSLANYLITMLNFFLLLLNIHLIDRRLWFEWSLNSLWIYVQHHSTASFDGISDMIHWLAHIRPAQEIVGPSSLNDTPPNSPNSRKSHHLHRQQNDRTADISLVFDIPTMVGWPLSSFSAQCDLGESACGSAAFSMPKRAWERVK